MKASLWGFQDVRGNFWTVTCPQENVNGMYIPAHTPAVVCCLNLDVSKPVMHSSLLALSLLVTTHGTYLHSDSCPSICDFGLETSLAKANDPTGFGNRKSYHDRKVL
jgi:hypothetical protein